jgi:transposase-like protein
MSTLLPLAEIALPPPELQIRAIHPDWIARLSETDPDEWDPIEVCPWPDWARRDQDNGSHSPYMVVGGVHRTLAARELRRDRVRVCHLAAPATELDYRREAFRSNQRHGERMSANELIAHARYLRRADPSRSESDLAREMGVNRNTLHNWLSGRDTNAGRSVRGAQSERRYETPTADLGWVGMPTVDLDARRLAEIERSIAKALATDPTDTLAPADALAWVASLSPTFRRSMAEQVGTLALFWGSLYAALDAAPEGRRQDG